MTKRGLNMNWWNISVFCIIPIFSVGVMLCIKRNRLWLAPFVSTVLSCFISAALTFIVSVVAMPSILYDNEHRALFFLSLILQFIIIFVLSVIGFVIKYIFHNKNRK